MNRAKRTCLGLLLLMAPGTAGAAVWHVPAQFPTIQAAVDAAAAGDEVVVAAGVYVEQVVITRNLTLSGAGQGQTVVMAPAYMPHEILPNHFNAVIHVETPATAATVRDLTIDGGGRGRAGTFFIGLIYYHAGGRAERLEIARIHDEALTAMSSGVGLVSLSGPGEALALHVEGISIHHFQKTGLVCYGAGCTRDIRDVVVDASGLHTETAQNGFELLVQTNGTLSGCTARGCWYSGVTHPNVVSVGFLFFFAGLWEVTDCNADSDQAGVYAITGEVDLQGATVTGHPMPLRYNYGMVFVPNGGSLADASGPGQPRAVLSAETVDVTPGPTRATASDCVVLGAGVPGSVGMLLYTDAFQLGLDLARCRITDWDLGVFSNEDGDGRIHAQARGCLIRDNQDHGIFANTVSPFDARGNAWGDASGPHHAVSNPAGTGDRVSDHVVFAPWLHGNLACGPVPLYIAQDDAAGGAYTDEVEVFYLGGGSAPVYGYSLELTWDTSRLTANAADVSRPTQGPFASATLFQAMPIPGGVRVDAALGGGRAGLESGLLLRVRYKLVGEPDYTEIPVHLLVRSLRDNANVPVTGWATDDGLVIADVQAPVIHTLKAYNLTLPLVDSLAKDDDQLSVEAEVAEGDPLFDRGCCQGDLVYMLGGVGWELAADSYAGGVARWTGRPALLYPRDGPVSYGVTVRDPAGNVTGAVGTITADNTPPLAPSGFAAEPGHDRITLHWDAPAGLDANLSHLAVRSRTAGDYPYFAGTLPAYPAGPTEGSSVYEGLGSGIALTYPADGTGRDAFCFQAFAVDRVGLSSAPASGARARALNYRLADVTGKRGASYDGLTDIYDITRLGDTYDLTASDPGFDAECDIGPVDATDGGPLPRPDGSVGFEDLMVFAGAFGEPSALRPAPQSAALPPRLSWGRTPEGHWILTLTEPCPALKGLRLRVDLPADAAAVVRPGALLGSQAAPVFLRGSRDGHQVSLAVLGGGVGVEGTGELLRLETSRPVDRLAPTLELRDIGNAPLPVDGVRLPTASPLPTAFASLGSYPNPFNPSTTIVFDLPRALPTRLEVFSLDGRRVAVLCSGVLEAGRHGVSWNGRDAADRLVAAGSYLYRLQAGPWTAAGKLDLVK